MVYVYKHNNFFRDGQIGQDDNQPKWAYCGCCPIANEINQNKLEEFDLNVFLLEDKTKAHVEVGARTLFVDPLAL